MQFWGELSLEVNRNRPWVLEFLVLAAQWAPEVRADRCYPAGRDAQKKRFKVAGGRTTCFKHYRIEWNGTEGFINPT